MELWSSGVGVETCRRYRGTELWRCAAGVALKRYGDGEFWRLAAGVGTWRR